MLTDGRSGSKPVVPILQDVLKAVAAMAVTLAIIAAAIAVASAVSRLVVEAGSIAQSDFRYDQAYMTWIALLVFQVIVVVLTVMAAGFGGQVFKSLALVPPRASLRSIGLTFILSGLVLAAYSAMAIVFFYDAVERDIGVFKDLIVPVSQWLPLLALIIGAPLSEELLFRGFLLGRLAQTRLGFLGATLLSTLGWTALHLQYSPVGLIEVFIAGLLFSWALWRTGSLWVPLAFHAIYNGVVVVAIHYFLLQPA